MPVVRYIYVLAVPVKSFLAWDGISQIVTLCRVIPVVASVPVLFPGAYRHYEWSIEGDHCYCQ